ncbi:MAG: hypothetical protein AMJ72_12320 [Acidithiobacillales bacterium SM1_46]|nr:MAG: hypothetical protein AMJ72_12320 [Acidithiobacillales bacterium SM1_46]
MPRVHHVKSARKDNPVAKKGESYYWWKFRYGGKRYSKTPPKPSQLTQSPYFSSIRSLVEMIEEQEVRDEDMLNDLKEQVRDELESIQSECQDSLDNMPDALQYSPTGELLQERIDACDSAISDIDMIDEFEFEEESFEDKYDEDDFEDDKEREEMRDQHEGDEDSRREQELIEWCESSVSEMIEYVSNCEV